MRSNDVGYAGLKDAFAITRQVLSLPRPRIDEQRLTELASEDLQILYTALGDNSWRVRKEAKEHGTGRIIEGNLPAGGRVVVVEDVITSGGSALRAITAVDRSGT